MAYRDSSSSSRSPSSSPRLLGSPFPASSSSRLPLPLWKQGPSSMSSPLSPEAAIPSTVRLSPLKLALVILATFLVSQLVPSLLPSGTPTSPAPSAELFPGRFEPSAALAPPFAVQMDRYQPTTPPPPKGIPNLVHFVFGYKGDEGELFPYYAYLAVRSALVNLKPDEILFHHLHEPYGPFWDLIKPHLTLVKTPAPTEIYGKPLRHFAYQADVIRLEALIERGGIYLDIDTYVVRPFTPLMSSEMVMGMEALVDSPTGEPQGLCNAVIISSPKNAFLERWLRSYDTFVEGNWSGHSVQKPWELARAHPSEVTVLSPRAFFWPLWSPSQLELVHDPSTPSSPSAYDFEATGQFAYHAWESKAHLWLDALTPRGVEAGGSAFERMVKAFSTTEDEQAYRKWEVLAQVSARS